MRWIWVLILIAVSGVALADDTATRVAVIEKDVKLLREDVRDLKNQIPTRAEHKALYDMVNAIRDTVNPKLEKVDTLTAWKDSHMQAHNLVEKGKDRSLYVWFSLFGLAIAAVAVGSNYILAKRNGNRG